MIGYTTVGTNDIEKAAAFYDGLLIKDDVVQMTPNDRVRLWIKKGAPMFGIAKPYDGEPATIGNGTMIGLSAANPEEVHSVYEKAIQLGATDEGEPGPRGTGGFYGGYFRDLDGNKLVVFCRVKK
jgi:catechol 2,3-dioxygenase-like lactoylglutathione lyase family enzyme